MNTWEQFLLVHNREPEKEMMLFSGGRVFFFRHTQVSAKEETECGQSFLSPLLTWISSLTAAALVPGQLRFRKWYCVMSLAAIVLARTLN